MPLRRRPPAAPPITASIRRSTARRATTASRRKRNDRVSGFEEVAIALPPSILNLRVLDLRAGEAIGHTILMSFAASLSRCVGSAFRPGDPLRHQERSRQTFASRSGRSRAASPSPARAQSVVLYKSCLRPPHSNYNTDRSSVLIVACDEPRKEF